MPSQTTLTLRALREVLQTAHEHVDLSTVDGTPRVHTVDPDFEGSLRSGPQVYLGEPTWEITYDAIQGLYLLSGRQTWLAQMPATQFDPEVRLELAIDVASDIVKAWQIAHFAKPGEPGHNAQLRSLESLLASVTGVSGGSQLDGVVLAGCAGIVTWTLHMEGTGA